jgi:hypothetical protein
MTITHNAEELASTAQEVGAEVIRGIVRCPGREGRWRGGGAGDHSGRRPVEERASEPHERTSYAQPPRCLMGQVVGRWGKVSLVKVLEA